MRLDYLAAKRYVQLECESTGKSIQFHRAGTIPSAFTDGKVIHVEEPNSFWSDERWRLWEYEVYHEIGHEAPENYNPHWKEVIEEKKIHTQSMLGSMLNLVSDHIQEKNRTGVYRGRDEILKRGREQFTEGQLSDVATSSKTHEGSLLKVAYIYDTYRREKWNEYLAGRGERAAAELTGKEQELWDKLYTSGIKIEEGKNEWDSYRIAKELLDAMGEDSEELEKQAQKAYEQAKAKGKGGGKGEGRKGERGEGEAVEGELSDEAKEERDGYAFHNHYEKPEEHDGYNRTGHGQHIEYDDDIGSSEFTPNEPQIVDLKTGNTGKFRVDSYEKDRYNTMIEGIDGGKILAAQVKRLLVSMKQLRWEHGHKRGHISSKNLWKARRPIYEMDVYKKRTTQLELNTAVSILADHSGSMSGGKYAHACKAGLMLNEAMGKIGVPVELLGFSEDGRGPINVIIKPFTEVTAPQSELQERYASAGSWMCQNSDGESIVWAFNRLRKRKEKRRILIVLSDGSPASYNGSSMAEYYYTQQVVKSIEEDTPIEIYGIGIMDDNVKRIYKDHKVLHHADDLESMLLGLVKNKVLGIK